MENYLAAGFTDFQKDEIFFTIRDFYFVFDNVSDNLLQVIFWGGNGKNVQLLDTK